jgi:NADH:ubiquinone oxidoreductase subunit E
LESGKIDGVVFATHYVFLCSQPGQKIVEDAVKENKLNGIIVANCSPTLHERTFRNLGQKIGINPFMVEVANIREQCSWPHQEEGEFTTEKAIKIIKQIVAKLKGNQELIPAKIPINRKAMVIGAGISGIQTALDIADGGYEVYLVEKNPSIGGKMVQLSETFPTLDCPQCIMTPKMNDVAQHPNIHLLSYSEVEEFSGYVGNFKVKIKQKARSIDEEKCTGCGDCWNNCLVRNEPQIPEVETVAPMLEKEMLLKLDTILDRYKGESGVEIPILQDINIEYNYLPKEALFYVAEKLETPVSRLYEIGTFFNAFSLEPRGKHIVSVCLGTACHVQGAGKILERLEGDLKIKEGGTTEDMAFSLETVRCLGCCGLAPVVTIGEDLYGKVTQSRLSRILKKYKDK